MYPEQAQDLRLPDVAHQSDLSSDLQHLTLSEAVGRRPYSEDVADRNMARRKPVGTGPSRHSSEAANRNVKPLIPQATRHSEDVANWNMVQDEKPRTSTDQPQPLQVRKRGSISAQGSGVAAPISGRGLTHKQNDKDLRRTSVDAARPRSPVVRSHEPKRSVDSDRHRIKRSSLEKPLPSRPSADFAEDLNNDKVVRWDVGSASTNGGHPGYTNELADKAIDLTGIVDLSRTEDATLHERWAPAVTHEKVIEDVHYIREEHITREIHSTYTDVWHL